MSWKIIFIGFIWIYSTLCAVGQATPLVHGTLTDKRFWKGCLIKMIVADTVYQSINVDSTGSFRFWFPAPTREYEVEVYCVNNCIPDIKYKIYRSGNVDSICVNITFDDIVRSLEGEKGRCDTLYYVGCPAYQDSFLRLVGLRYGLLYINIGCMGNVEDERRMNREAVARINKRLGRDWDKIYWHEVTERDKFQRNRE
ncbi:hypothetical protein [uncultured Butyricimonas sp.]|uniref:hypothetical protein n=1 Tax=uncultured Butyricimonas sp. TaxID=1268785 RepID=UPI0026DAE591|nr:hypothetical protein [uncultured Butyricimonas sp.]